MWFDWTTLFPSLQESTVQPLITMELGRCFDDLSDDLVAKILSHLPNKELLRIESVSQLVQRAVRRVLIRVEVVAFDYSDPTATCHHLASVGDRFRAILISRSKSVEWSTLLLRCSQVQCLDLRRVNSFDVLTNIVKSCPQLECLCLAEIGTTYYKWKKFAEQVGPRLRHLSVRCWFYSNFARLNMLIKACSRLERCHLESLENQAMKMLSLNQLPDQTAISLDIVRVINFDNVDHVFNVITRADILTVNFFALQVIGSRSNNLERLRHLTIFKSLPYIIGNQSIDFTALETLKLIRFDDQDLLVLTWYQFPKLRTLHLDTYNFTEEGFKTLCNRVKSLKRLILEDSKSLGLPAPGDSVLTLDQLEEVHLVLEINKKYQLPAVIAMLEKLSEVKTVRKVRAFFRFEKYSSVSNEVMQQLVDALGQLKRMAPEGVDIVIRFNYAQSCEKSRQQLNHWDQMFSKQPEVTRIRKLCETEHHLYSKDLAKLIS